MRYIAILFSALFCCACGASDLSLENWKAPEGTKCTCTFANGKLVIKSGKNMWNIANGNRNTAVPGKAIKFQTVLEILPPARAMMFFDFYAVKDNKTADTAFHTVKIADTPGFVRKYEQTFNVPEGITQFELRMNGRPGHRFAIHSMSVSTVPALPEPEKKVIGKYRPLTPASDKRHRENLDRGVVAFQSGKGAYISWRLLKSDPEDIAFDIYRDGKKITSSPIKDTTDYYDSTPGKKYSVKPAGGKGISGSAETAAALEGEISPCKIYHLANPKARASKVGIGDLDGDGTYDYVVKYSPSNVDPWYTAYSAPEGTCKFEAVNGKTGKVMWTKDLGWSIETGIWYSPYIIYDFDCDGKAEVVFKTGKGDPRDPDGKVTSGEEFLTVCDGKTGKVIAQTAWPSRDGFMNLDIPYNFYSRNQLAVAYLDGKTPYIIAMRGTYSLMLVEAWQLTKGKLVNAWKYSSAGYSKEFQGQGAHTTRCCDIDGDGKDELVLGNMALDDDGQPMWSNGRRHPDFLFVADLLPQRDGLESVTCLEINNTKGGLNMTCAKTGKCIWELKEPHFHIHFGFCGDIDPLYRGVLIGGTDRGSGKQYPANAWIMTADGKMLSSGKSTQFFGDSPMFAYWDGDLRKEHLKGYLKKYNGGEVGGMYNGTHLTTADVYGDWREEIITAAEGQLRIYSTDIPAMDRRVSLMQDHFYRMAITTSSCGYHYDPIPQILPSSTATDVVLTMKKTDLLQITVTAPMDKKVSGTLNLDLPQNVKSDFQMCSIELEKGGIWNKELKLRGTGVGKPGEIYASLKLVCGKVLKARTLTCKQKLIEKPVKPVGYWCNAEKFTKQTKGKAVIKNRVHLNDKYITAWLKPGHRINWQIKVPQKGKYKIVFRYATKRNNVFRTLHVNGKNCGTIRFLPTGAMGASALDWTDYSPEFTLDLPEGIQKISMQCTSGALSLDTISLVPCK